MYKSQSYEEMLTVFPEHLKAHLNMGRIYFETGDLAKSREYYVKAVQIDNQNQEALQMLLEINRLGG